MNKKLKEEIERLKYVIYTSSSGICDETCPFYTWYDGPLCGASGDYLNDQTIKECKEAREKYNGK